MSACPWTFLTDQQKHIISLVGGGGKTTIMYELAAFFAQQGRRTVCLTTTHIWQPELNIAAIEQAPWPLRQPVYAADWQQVEHLWHLGHYAVIGACEAGSGELVAPSDALLDKALKSCDVALIESDGSKQMPCKLPREGEPVLLNASDIVIAVAGLDALGKSLEEACFRWQLGREIFTTSCNLLMDEAKLAQILLSEKGSRKCVGTREYYIALNKCDLVMKEQALALKSFLVAQGMDSERIWLRNFSN